VCALLQINKVMGFTLMSWLDPNDDILTLLRGSINGNDASHPWSRAEVLFEIQLSIVMSALLITIIVAAATYLWSLRVRWKLNLRARSILSRNNGNVSAVS
jgi:hypothetical protein